MVSVTEEQRRDSLELLDLLREGELVQLSGFEGRFRYMGPAVSREETLKFSAREKGIGRACIRTLFIPKSNILVEDSGLVLFNSFNLGIVYSYEHLRDLSERREYEKLDRKLKEVGL